MENHEEVKWYNIYEVRDILSERGVIVPLGKDGYHEIVKNGFVFDEYKFMWREVDRK